jgi:hypothetical protein
MKHDTIRNINTKWKDWRLREDDVDTLDELVQVLVELDGYTDPKPKGKFNPAMMKYSNTEAKSFAEDDVKKMGTELNKASQKSISIMLGSVKDGKYDAMDMIRAIKSGGKKAGDVSAGVPEMLNVLWSKVEKRFRKYLGGKKRR